MDSGEREREREWQVEQLLSLMHTWKLLHTVIVLLYISQVSYPAHSETHTLTHIYGPTVCVWSTGLNLRLRHPWLPTIWTLLLTRIFTDGDTVNRSDPCYGFIIFLVPTLKLPLTLSWTGLQRFAEVEDVGFICTVFNVRIHSLIGEVLSLPTIHWVLKPRLCCILV